MGVEIVPDAKRATAEATGLDGGSLAHGCDPPARHDRPRNPGEPRGEPIERQPKKGRGRPRQPEIFCKVSRSPRKDAISPPPDFPIVHITMGKGELLMEEKFIEETLAQSSGAGEMTRKP